MFRNAKQAEFRAMKVDVEKLIAATKKYYQGSGGRAIPRYSCDQYRNAIRTLRQQREGRGIH